MDITLSHVSHLYNIKTPFERAALKDVNLNLPSGSFTSIIGHTGSGKSTLVQHINGLLKPTEGSVTVGDVTIRANEKQPGLKKLRKKVGLVFQYPEHQLFEETILKDICFGPVNFGVPLDEAEQRAKQALQRVGLPLSYLDKSPFDLSGGQMRRVAIAGVLAVQPEAIILDEPTAGLDPRGRKEILTMFQKLHKEQGLTTIMVTHNMDDAAFYSDQVVVMDKGQMVMADSPEHVFSQKDALQAIGLDVPVTMHFLDKFAAKAGLRIAKPVFTVDETADELIDMLKRGADRRV